MDWAKTTARGDERHLSFGIWCDLHERFYGMVKFTVLWGTMKNIDKLQLQSLFVAFAESRTKGHSTDIFVHGHSTTLGSQKKRLLAISIIYKNIRI